MDPWSWKFGERLRKQGHSPGRYRHIRQETLLPPECERRQSRWVQWLGPRRAWPLSWFWRSSWRGSMRGILQTQWSLGRRRRRYVRWSLHVRWPQSLQDTSPFAFQSRCRCAQRTCRTRGRSTCREEDRCVRGRSAYPAKMGLDCWYLKNKTYTSMLSINALLSSSEKGLVSGLVNLMGDLDGMSNRASSTGWLKVVWFDKVILWLQLTWRTPLKAGIARWRAKRDNIPKDLKE